MLVVAFFFLLLLPKDLHNTSKFYTERRRAGTGAGRLCATTSLWQPSVHCCAVTKQWPKQEVTWQMVGQVLVDTASQLHPSHPGKPTWMGRGGPSNDRTRRQETREMANLCFSAAHSYIGRAVVRRKKALCLSWTTQGNFFLSNQHDNCFPFWLSRIPYPAIWNSRWYISAFLNH